MARYSPDKEISAQPRVRGSVNGTRQLLAGSAFYISKFATPFYLLVLFCNLLLAACGDNTPNPGTPTANPIQETSKIDTTLRDLLVSYQSGGLEAARTYARETGLLDLSDRVRFGLTLTSPTAVPAITNQVQKMGGEVYSSAGDQIAVAVQIDKLTTYFNQAEKRNFFQELASFKEVKELKLLLPPSLARLDMSQLNSPALNQGVSLIGADRWQKAGFNGQGIKVGIIDGGFSSYRSFLGGALPPPAQLEFQSFLPGQTEGTENHGVAVAEVVHSLAPDASLFLAPIEDEIGFIRAVQFMMDKKVQIIQISLGWGGIFPGDGTGRMDEKLDEARRAGILPVVSTGNYGQSHYMASLNPDSNGFQIFSGSKTTLKLTTESASAWVSLRWEEPWDAPKTNLDLYILDPSQKPLASSRNEQGQGFVKPPTELAPFKANPGQVYYVQVKIAGKDAPIPPNLRFHLFAYNATLEEANPESSLATPGDARGALSIGATGWQTDSLELYSSRGPTGDNRAKPDLVGPSGVSGSVLKQPFLGTSAAAPQVAGTAAVIWSAARELSADQVAAYLQRNALDLGTPGPDALFGFGRVKLGPEAAARQGLPGLLGPVANGPPFSDEFKASDSGLPDNFRAYYNLLGPADAQGYRIVASPGHFGWSSYLDHSFEEFRADVTIQPLANPTALFYGLIFWQQGKEDYYAWLVSGQSYALLKRDGPNWTTLSDWSQDAALPGNTSAHSFSLEATAGYLLLKLDGKVLQTVTFKEGTKAAPPRQLGGKFGFGAGLFGAGQSQEGTLPVVTFSHLLITPLSTR